MWSVPHNFIRLWWCIREWICRYVKKFKANSAIKLYRISNITGNGSILCPLTVKIRKRIQKRNKYNKIIWKGQEEGLYLSCDFFIVLDLRLTKVGARRCSFFYVLFPAANSFPNKFRIPATLSLSDTGIRILVRPVSLSSSTIESTNL